jgi:hypothetical protein
MRIAVGLLFLLIAAPALAQKTDVITLQNGDRITGEVKNLDRGRVEFSTDDIGTIYLEWDKIATLVSKNVFEVIMSDGRRFLGSLHSDTTGSLSVVGPEGAGPLSLLDVTGIRQIGSSFWAKLDGSLDVGFSYTRSSTIAQLNLNSTTIYRRPAFEGRLTGSATFTKTEDEDEDERDDRASAQLALFRYRGQRGYTGIGGGIETNDSLGLALRTQAGLSVGARWVNSNRAQVWSGIGIYVNNEQGVDAEATQNVEAMMTLRSSYYKYDRPRTNLDFSFEYYPSLSDWGRQRIQLDAALRREIWKDFFLAVTVFDSFDSRPPNPESNKNDVGVVLSFGWTY